MDPWPGTKGFCTKMGLLHIRGSDLLNLKKTYNLHVLHIFTVLVGATDSVEVYYSNIYLKHSVFVLFIVI